MKQAARIGFLSMLVLLGGCTWMPNGGKLLSGEAGKQLYPEKLTLNWFVPAPDHARLPSRDLDFVRQTIEQKFHVEINLQYRAPGNDYQARLRNLLATDPPDMWRNATSDGGQQFALQGLLADMTPYVTPGKMPNYFTYWMIEQELTRYQAQEQFVRAPLPYNKTTYSSYYIRKDWLDNLGLDIPQTYEAYLAVLRAFTYGDPDRNGKQDTYGFTTGGEGRVLGRDWPERIKHGLSSPGIVRNGRLDDDSMALEMEDVLTDILQLMDEKLVDPDWYLNKSPQHIEKAVQGKVGVIAGHSREFALDSNPQSLQYRARQVNPEANWVPFTMLGDQPFSSKPGPSNPFLFSRVVAERAPERLERTVAILDWLASEEGYVLTHYGQEGKHYTRDGSVIRLILEPFASDVTKQGDFLSIWAFFTSTVPQPDVFGLTVIDPRETDRDREVLAFLNALPRHEWLGTSIVAPEGFDLEGYRKRQNMLFYQMLFQEKSAARWPQYREEMLVKYGGNTLYEKYNADLRAAGIVP